MTLKVHSSNFAKHVWFKSFLKSAYHDRIFNPFGVDFFFKRIGLWKKLTRRRFEAWIWQFLHFFLLHKVNTIRRQKISTYTFKIMQNQPIPIWILYGINHFEKKRNYVIKIDLSFYMFNIFYVPFGSLAITNI